MAIGSPRAAGQLGSNDSRLADQFGKATIEISSSALQIG
jgi:hypothetical protein